MTTERRRFFWGRSLAQALARAARHYGLAPEQLNYSLREKRHGFVKHPRAVIVEIDPQEPARVTTAGAASVAPAPAVPAPAPPGRTATKPKRDRATAEEPSWDPPDDESQLAAAEAARRLLAFAGLDLKATVRSDGERLEVELDGADRDRLRAAGVELLDAFEALLPRAVVALAERRVRCRVDGAGLRKEREREVEALAREAAVRARAEGEALLPPLPPAERRLVHLVLRDEPEVVTESVGRGAHRRVRIVAGDRPSAGR